MHRFVGATQIVGGLTLVSAYQLEAESLQWAPASAILTVIGVAQIATGVGWIANARSLKTAVALHPGTLAAMTLLAATAVATLGGSGAEAVWVTSAQTWLIAAGALLPVRGLIVTPILMTAATSAIWVAADGSFGGYQGDGDYLIATIALAKFLAVGLLLGYLTGTAWRLLARWHVIEVHERGVIRELVERLTDVERAAGRLAECLADARASRELVALRQRLVRGLQLRDPAGSFSLPTVLEEFIAAGDGPPVSVHVDDAAAGQDLDVLLADALAAVLRRQVDNTVRHAPSATRVDIAASVRDGRLLVEVTDDGGGTEPERSGAGTAWSKRQLARVGGRLEYFQAPAGTGMHIELPQTAARTTTTVSIRSGLEQFSGGLIDVLRWASYVGDTLAATGIDGIGHRWVYMPLAAVVIEFVIQRGVPGLQLSRPARQTVASGVVVALTVAYSLPQGSPETLVPVSTSVVVLSQLLLQGRYVAWGVAEIVRAIAVSPFVVRGEASVLELVVIYPVVFNAAVYGLRRFIERASSLEGTVLDALGRAALAGAAIRGLALHHDAIDVLLREAPRSTEVREAAAELEDAVRELSVVADAAEDPHELMRSGMVGALSLPVRVTTPRAPQRRRPAATADRITLVEIAALAADERAACAPPGLFGRRRLRSLRLDWGAGADHTALSLAAEPTLATPDRRRVESLAAVASTLGLKVSADRERLTIQGAVA